MNKIKIIHHGSARGKMVAQQEESMVAAREEKRKDIKDYDKMKELKKTVYRSMGKLEKKKHKGRGKSVSQ